MRGNVSAFDGRNCPKKCIEAVRLARRCSPGLRRGVTASRSYVGQWHVAQKVRLVVVSTTCSGYSKHGMLSVPPMRRFVWGGCPIRQEADAADVLCQPVRISLTTEGHTLLAVAINVLTELVQHADVHAGATSALALRLPSTFAIRWLLPRLPDIDRALNGTKLRISTSADDTPEFTTPDADAIVVRGRGQWAGLDAIALFAETLTPMCTADLAASLKSAADLADVTLLHPGPSHEEWRCWLDHVGATRIDAGGGLVFDTLELTFTAASQGHGVAIGDPRMARDRLDAGALVMPFGEVAQNGLGYFLVYPSQRAAQSKIRALADVLIRLAQEEDPSMRSGFGASPVASNVNRQLR